MQAQQGRKFYERFEGLFNKDELEEALSEENTFFIEYAETNWLEQYFKMRALARKTEMPSITSQIRDTPTGISNEFRSKTEDYALKSIFATEWVNYLHEKIEMLPSELRELIEIKYLTRNTDGKLFDDPHVYTQLNVSRAKYYRMKKSALEELGRLLYPS